MQRLAQSLLLLVLHILGILTLNFGDEVLIVLKSITFFFPSENVALS